MFQQEEELKKLTGDWNRLEEQKGQLLLEQGKLETEAEVTSHHGNTMIRSYIIQCQNISTSGQTEQRPTGFHKNMTSLQNGFCLQQQTLKSFPHFQVLSVSDFRL